MKYREYFKIDPEYFPQATEELINSGKVDWKKFYPHETFIKLLNDTIRVFTRQQKLSLWVEGAYGTGKSHAVLTLQKLIEASAEETKAYFDNYNFMSNDLYNKLQGVKSQGKILVVRRYGSSSVNNDNDLIFSIQESIINALRKNNIHNLGANSLKEAIIVWLSSDANKLYFNSIISNDQYSYLFDGDTADSILNKLQKYSENSLIDLMNKIYKVADDLPRAAFKVDMDKLIEWTKEIIEKNNLKAIFFIWDEFTDYLKNNLRHLTEFQKLLEISLTNPFYFCLVVHESTGIFNDTDKDRKRILDRFVQPFSKIELPENMAFRLMGQAMVKSDDEHIRAAWEEIAEDLNSRMHDCRKRVMESAKITEQELLNILPIHPYTALLLKHISSVFDSNQRSMFDFIKNDRGDEIKGFQWFIDNYDADEEELLTIDLLWDFFYEKGRNNLTPSIKNILDNYNRQNVNLLNTDEKKVLKTILLLQAISQKVGDKVEIFIPNDKNVNYAYEGSELENGRAANIANKLCKDEILYKRPMGSGKFQYSAMINAGDPVAVNKFKEELKKTKKTKDFVYEGELTGVLGLTGALALRYAIEFATTDDFTRKINELRNKENKFANKLLVVVTFAKNDEESAALNKQIKEAVKNDTYRMMFIDASTSPLGMDALEQYIDHMANSMYQRRKQNQDANQSESMAKDILKRWKDRIVAGEFLLYSTNQRDGLRLANIDELHIELVSINRKAYPYGIEQFKVIDNMFIANSLKLGAECGVKETTSGTFRSGNPATKLENALEGAWGVERYWEKPDSSFKNPCIKKIKIHIEEVIRKSFQRDGKVSIAKIYESLAGDEYGFMPCNLTAFVLGFVLKEYAKDTYRWNDGQISDTMSILKLKEMIDEIIKLQITPNPKYKDKYIVAMTPEEKMFSEVTAKVFNIPANQCASIQQTRDRIRIEMKKLTFPLWCLKHITSKMTFSCDTATINQLIDEYCGIANTNNIDGRRTESDLALSIGKICIKNSLITEDLMSLVNKPNCQKGMEAYISTYKEGELLTVAKKIGVENSCLAGLKNKFDADAAHWVWNTETANQKIDELIIEYQIIEESNKLTSKTRSFDEMIQAWCDKLGILKLSYEAIKNSCDDINPLLELLVMIKKSGILQDSQRSKFLNLLQLKQDSVRNFFANQIALFKEACSFQLFGLNEEEVNEVFNLLNTGMFTKEKSEFITSVDKIIEDYKNSQENRKLKEFWKSKTGSTTPRDWSAKHQSPILSMVPVEEITEAKVAFAAVNRTKPEKKDIRDALAYLEKATFFDFLNDEDKRNRMFMECVVKNYSVMLSDPDEVRDYLCERVSADPYDWYGSIEVDNALKLFAEMKYNTGGSSKALKVIEEMDEVTVKSYLKRLIKENITVGMEIIKNN